MMKAVVRWQLLAAVLTITAAKGEVRTEDQRDPYRESVRKVKGLNRHKEFYSGDCCLWHILISEVMSST